MMNPYKKLAVLGAGAMGAGISQVAIQAKLEVWLYDIQPDALYTAKERMITSIRKAIERGKQSAEVLGYLESHLVLTSNWTDLEQDDLDLVIEAAPEDMALKKSLFAKLDATCPTQTVFASNTSSLSITAMGAATKRPGHVAGMHFFNPVPQMKLVEVIQGKETRLEVVQHLCQLAKAMGKTPVIAQDTPGFIVNRVARSFYGEAFRLLAEGVADVAMLDAVMREEGGFAMGPFELIDLIGMDINYAVTQSVYQAYFQEPRFQPHPIQRQMVEAGHLGRKSGRGFYTYDAS
jgi:3-hydroxybutyryl-CoA dehydrogenase